MDTRDTLERSLREDLDDWQRWLVYADWLASRGDPAARAITLEHRRETLRGRERDQLADIVAELEALEQPESLRELSEAGWELDWRCGFVVGARVAFTPERVAELGALLGSDRAPLLASLRVHVVREFDEDYDYEDEDYAPAPVDAELLEALLEHDLGGLTRFAFEYGPLGAEGAGRLGAHAGFTQLRELDLRYTFLDDASLDAVLQASWTAGLRSLALQRNRLGPQAARSLARCPALADLRVLDLRDNRLGLEGARELAARGQLTSLRALYLYRDDIGADGALALAESDLPLAIRRYYAALHGARHD